MIVGFHEALCLLLTNVRVFFFINIINKFEPYCCILRWVKAGGNKALNVKKIKLIVSRRVSSRLALGDLMEIYVMWSFVECLEGQRSISAKGGLALAQGLFIRADSLHHHNCTPSASIYLSWKASPFQFCAFLSHFLREHFKLVHCNTTTPLPVSEKYLFPAESDTSW